MPPHNKPIASPHFNSQDNGTQWRVEARKFDGQLHYSLPGQLVEDDGERLWLHCTPDVPINHVTRGWQRPLGHPSDMFFWRSAWYNVYVNWDAEGQLDEFYCNVGLPPTISGNTITFVDLDLDVLVRADDSVYLLDADEFEEHIRHYNYPREIQRNARLAALDIITLWRMHKTPFNWLANRDPLIRD